MSRTFKISIIGIIVLGIIGFFVADFLCKLEVKCKNCSQVSQEIEYSKKNNLYLGEYEYEKRKIDLKHYNQTIIIKDVWFEKQWFYNSNICLLTKIDTRKGVNLIIDFEKSIPDSFLFSMTPMRNGKKLIGYGGINETKKQMIFDFEFDEISILIKEKDPKKGIGWRNGGIVTDTIKLKRK